MQIHFYKYQGVGNDFIILDNRNNGYPGMSVEKIKFLCNRHFGIGADGLMLLKNHNFYDFEMEYYNSDGTGGTMCGNGGRCMVSFAKKMNIIDISAHFIASDGEHAATIDKIGNVNLKMIDVLDVKNNENHFLINTGSPHYVIFKDHLDSIDVFNEGRQIRNSKRFKDKGTNVNFVEKVADGIKIRTYERGVEDETLACGTGSVAAAISYFIKYKPPQKTVNVHTLGGDLKVTFTEFDASYKDVYLSGPAEFVFEGEIEIDDNL